MNADFLVEIHTEELPPKALQRLGKVFLSEIEDKLRKTDLNFTGSRFFATPRRLAVLINNLAPKQADSEVERKGPAVEAAFDKNGEPTQACIGFARSCNVSPKELMTIKNNTGSWVGFRQKVAGKTVQQLLPSIVQQALAALPIPKRMRWGDKNVEFVRPVHSVIMLYGDEIIDAEILGCKTGRKTRGHRFMSKKEWIEIKKPNTYATQLAKEYVIVDFNERKEKIRLEAQALNSEVNIQENLLDEVTGLVEWPVAICGKFDEKFLAVPQEALISAMQDHQRYFPIVNKSGKLLPQFIAISNIESKDKAHVIAGNERVLRARLSDAAFFFEKDKKQTLESRIPALKNIIFQAKLGTLYDKAERLSHLTMLIADQLGVNTNKAKQLAFLAKTDLTTELVGEFPELQGVAGYYYAYLVDGLNQEDAKALYEQYRPRFANDELPVTLLGKTLAIADRIDTLVGVFGINQQPTGDKDPFGLRRAAIGILRILIEGKHNLDLQELLQSALKKYSSIKLENQHVVEDVLTFMLDRLKPLYLEQGISADVFAAVSALNLTKPYDIHCRIQAVQAFKKLAEAESLSVANKRVSNILSKYDNEISLAAIDEKLFEVDAERVLAAKLKEQQNSAETLSKDAQYQELLSQLAHLREPVDNFFDQVLVMTEDKPRRENRLLLLKQLRELFLHVADIALLQ